MHPDDKKSRETFCGCLSLIGCAIVLLFNILVLFAFTGGLVYFFKEILR